jgi:hypothetical protein
MSLRGELAFWGIELPEDVSIDALVQRLKDRPCQNSLALVGLSTVLFYMAEADHNGRVNDIWDAFEYCSTCISVGYADIFPRTPVGKIIGSLLMMIGPAMAAKPKRWTVRPAPPARRSSRRSSGRSRRSWRSSTGGRWGEWLRVDNAIQFGRPEWRTRDECHTQT